MFSRKMIALFVTMISVLSFASASSAAVISIDFNQSTTKNLPAGSTPTVVGNPSYTFGGMGPTEAWNPLYLGNGLVAPGGTTSGPLLQSGGASTSVVFTLTSGPSWVPIDNGSSTPDDLRRDYGVLITGGTDTPSNLNWTITGLPAGNYDLRFYGDNTPSGYGYFTVDENHNLADDTGETIYTNDTAEFLSVSSLGSTITGHVNRPGTNMEWVGLQIRGTFVAEAVPEPS
ncbi:MAG: hypothetical protein K8T91_02155, partial [Planctomycetes bacterium]|nr:hypothetical protein [Planctomycetota bacterium]